MIIEASQIIVTPFSSASPLTSFCAAIKDKQIRETRRNPVPKQHCISVPHSGSGRGLSCFRLWNRIQKVCGTVWEAQSSFQWHLLKSHSSWAAITSLYDENHCSRFFQAFVFLIYLPNRAIGGAIRPFCCCTMPSQAKGSPEFRGRVSDATVIQNVTATNGLDTKPNYFPPASNYIWCLFLWTLLPCSKQSFYCTSVRLNCSTATHQEHTWGHDVKNHLRRWPIVHRRII